MAYTLHTTTNPVASRFSALAAEIKLAFARRAVYRRTYNELAALSDRELADLGIPRSSIRRVSREAADMV